MEVQLANPWIAFPEKLAFLGKLGKICIMPAHFQVHLQAGLLHGGGVHPAGFEVVVFINCKLFPYFNELLPDS